MSFLSQSFSSLLVCLALFLPIVGFAQDRLPFVGVTPVGVTPVGVIPAGVTSASMAQVDVTQLPGWRIMQDSRLGNCITCHQITLPYKVLKEQQGNFAPALSQVGAKYSREQLLQWVVDARVLKPQTLMPPYGSLQDLSAPILNKPVLDSSQINDVINVLVQLK